MRASSSPFTELFKSLNLTSLCFIIHDSTKRTRTTNASPSHVVPSNMMATSFPLTSWQMHSYSCSRMKGISCLMFELEVSGYPTSSSRSLKYSSLLKGVPLFKNALTNFTLNNLVVEGSVSPFGWFLSLYFAMAFLMSSSFLSFSNRFSLFSLCFLLEI